MSDLKSHILEEAIEAGVECFKKGVKIILITTNSKGRALEVLRLANIAMTKEIEEFYKDEISKTTLDEFIESFKEIY